MRVLQNNCARNSGYVRPDGESRRQRYSRSEQNPEWPVGVVGALAQLRGVALDMPRREWRQATEQLARFIVPPHDDAPARLLKRRNIASSEGRAQDGVFHG